MISYLLSIKSFQNLLHKKIYTEVYLNMFMQQ